MKNEFKLTNNDSCDDVCFAMDERNIAALVDELHRYWIDFCTILPDDIKAPSVTQHDLMLCVEHLFMILETNKRMNLTRIVEPHESVVLHLLDSMMLLPFVNQAPDGTLLDMGTGAGFPGLTLAICSYRPSVLLDSVGKKVDAVASVVRQLNIDHVEVVHDRVESYASKNPHSCSVVVARAVASLNVLLEYASPLLLNGGYLVVTKGVPSDDELHSASSVASLVGFGKANRYNFSLPADKGSRSIFVYRKVFSSQVKLPRAVGLAKKHPLT